jgi:sulfite reductase (NADPH) flavoprotein alpha-component
MLAGGKMQALQALLDGSSPEELIWINGYLNGLVRKGAPSNGHATAPTPTGVSLPSARTWVLYGTETGNARKLALALSTRLREAGLSAPATGMDQFRFTDLEKPLRIFVITSTQGEGEPPANAKKFFDQLQLRAHAFPSLEYAVLGLGDSSYPLFNKTADDLDALLAERSGKRLLPLVRCDVDYEPTAEGWFKNILGLNGKPVPVTLAHVSEAAKNGDLKPHAKKTYGGRIRSHVNLNDTGSEKSTWHIEISTEEPVAYEAGDALAIVPQNHPQVVDLILSLAGADPAAELATAKFTGTLRSLLTEKLAICHLLHGVVKKYAAIAGQEIPDVRFDLVDLLRIYPLKSADEFNEVVKMLSPIAPRLYSISSSPRVNDFEVHLTVSRHRFQKEGKDLFGLCSSFLGDLENGTQVNFHIHHNRAFKLPDTDRDIIMIGPGTGIAPFRSFLQERDATGARGRNWFFFGEQRFRTDFLYQSEIQQYHATGLLQKVSLAFSRDQQEKVYVQHRIEEEAREFFSWLQGGALLYISGTKHPMSDDVEHAILRVIAKEGGMGEEEARQYLHRLKEEGRYQKDVY